MRNWIAVENWTPKEGKYLTDGSYGVGASWYSDWSNKFQDCASNNDEGMGDMDGKVFTVTHVQALPASATAPTPEPEELSERELWLMQQAWDASDIEFRNGYTMANWLDAGVMAQLLRTNAPADPES